MARPPARDLTERELEVMHVFWKHGAATAAEVRDYLAAAGLDRAYTTVATLVRILYEKGFLEPMNQQVGAVSDIGSKFGEGSRKAAGRLTG